MSLEINCKAFANTLEEAAREYASNHHVKLVIITTIYADDASHVYMRNKLRAAERTNIQCEIVTCSSYQEILDSIDRYNNDDCVDGIIVQLPLPESYNVEVIQQLILPNKDIDGFHPLSWFPPCTPHGVIELLEHYNYPLDGKHCVVIGRSDIVGKPLARLLIHQDATVTVCNSHTSPELLKTLTASADYVFCAAGKPNLITLENVNPNAVYIDISINRNENEKLCGDLSPEAQQACKAYTPVPRGIGPITVAELMAHTCCANKFSHS